MPPMTGSYDSGDGFLYTGATLFRDDQIMTKSTKTSPNWKHGLAGGLALGMGLGVALDNLLLGIALTLCFGTALAYALAPREQDAG